MCLENFYRRPIYNKIFEVATKKTFYFFFFFSSFLASFFSASAFFFSAFFNLSCSVFTDLISFCNAFRSLLLNIPRACMTIEYNG